MDSPCTKSRVLKAIRGIWYFILVILILAAFCLPIALAIFWAELQSFYIVPILAGVVVVMVLAVIGVGFIIRFFTTRKKQPQFQVQLNKWAKILPILMLTTVFITYTYYYPTWYYDFGIPPKFGPYIAINAGGGIQVSWDTRSETLTRLVYGTSQDNLGLEAIGGEFFWELDATAKTKHHCILLVALTPDTVYYYQVPDFDKTVYSFRTPPPDNVLSNVIFTILGDTQGNINIQRQNIAGMKEKTNDAADLDFTLIAGDLSNRDDSISEWGMLFHSSSYGGIATHVPWMASSGNHETSSVSEQPMRYHFQRYFQNSFAGGWKTESGARTFGMYYSFNYSNVHVAIVDPFEYDTGTISAPQLAWLEADLTRANAANMWTFIVFHLSMYSTSEHGPYPELANQMEPLMKSQKIDAIFWGHDHIFEAYHAFSNESYGGTHCFMVSGGGGSLKDVTNEGDMGTHVWNGTKNEYGNYINYVAGAEDHRFDDLRGSEWQLYAERTHHFMLVNIYNQTATFTAYRTLDGSVIQSYTLTNH